MSKIGITCLVVIGLMLGLSRLSYAQGVDTERFMEKYKEAYQSMEKTDPELAAAFRNEAKEVIHERAIEFREPNVAPDRLIERMEKIERSAVASDKAKEIKIEQIEVKPARMHERPVAAVSAPSQSGDLIVQQPVEQGRIVGGKKGK